jgi:hypothetical protein
LDLGIIIGVIMIAVWFVFVFIVNNAPGFVHLLLTVGLFIVIWRIVARGAPMPKTKASPPAATPPSSTKRSR